MEWIKAGTQRKKAKKARPTRQMGDSSSTGSGDDREAKQAWIRKEHGGKKNVPWKEEPKGEEEEWEQPPWREVKDEWEQYVPEKWDNAGKKGRSWSSREWK